MSAVLSNCTVAVSGTHKDWKQSKIEKFITSNGGSFSKAIVNNETTHLVTTEVDYDKKSNKVKEAQQYGVHLVSLNWLLESIEKKQKQSETSYVIGTGSTAAATNGTQNGGKTGKRTAQQVSEDEEEEEKVPAKKAKSTLAKGKGRKAAAKAKEESEEPEEEEPQMTTVVQKGRAPVDELCPLKDSHHVYVDQSGVPFDAALNQTNIGNNNNKFYYCQLLEKDVGQSYSVFCHWGRVGDRGQSKMYANDTSLSNAVAIFNKQFKSKTGKNWDDRENATGGGGKYAYLSRNYEEDDDDTPEGGDGGNQGKGQQVDSKIDAALQRLMELIFSTKNMEQSMKELSYDSKKLPLGKLSKETISRGYQSLKELSEVVANKSQAVSNFGEYGRTYNEIVQELSNRYYTVIPHNFGRNVPPAIETPQMLKKEIELVENLSDMVITNKLMKETKAVDDVHPLDKQFESLGLNEAIPLDKSSTEFKNLEAYVHKSQGSTHRLRDLKVDEIFRITRSVEEDRWKAGGWDKLKNDNRMLLWHGSRSTNFAGILSQGLRIAPPEAPVNGYMFDKGCYLADIFSKSANYCNVHASGNNGLLLLCEAQLGDPMFELKHADYYAARNSKSAGALATKGLGRTAPLKWEDASIVNENLKGVKMPAVSGKESNITGDSKVSGTSLQYNEYIVYDVSQVKIRYLFRCTWA